MRNFAILFIGAILLAGCGEKENKTEDGQKVIDTDVVTNPATADQGSPSGDDVPVPVFSFEKEVHDFGKIVQGEKVAYSFKFKNTGNADLIITSAKGSCGCTVPEWPTDPIPPGGEGKIDVVFNSEGKSGQQNKKVTIVANTVPNTKVLAINGMVEVPVGE